VWFRARPSACWPPLPAGCDALAADELRRRLGKTALPRPTNRNSLRCPSRLQASERSTKCAPEPSGRVANETKCGAFDQQGVENSQREAWPDPSRGSRNGTRSCVLGLSRPRLPQCVSIGDPRGGQPKRDELRFRPSGRAPERIALRARRPLEGESGLLRYGRRTTKRAPGRTSVQSVGPWWGRRMQRNAGQAPPMRGAGRNEERFGPPRRGASGETMSALAPSERGRLLPWLERPAPREEGAFYSRFG
jgi:hypothetical protein